MEPLEQSGRAANGNGKQALPTDRIKFGLRDRSESDGRLASDEEAALLSSESVCCLDACAWSRRGLPLYDLEVPCRSGKARAHLSNTVLILSAVGGVGLFFALAALGLWLDLALHSRHAAECAARQQVAGPAAPLATLVRAAATAR